MRRIFLVLFLIAVIVGIPFLLKPRENFLANAQDSLVIISPHNEAIRFEFTRAFTEYYTKRTGRTIRLDWRLVGGTSEIARYLNSQFYAAFEYAWKSSGGNWNTDVQKAFTNSTITLPENADADTLEQKARRTFLSSNVSIGIDLFFGGGAYDFIQQAKAGRLVDCGLISKLPDVFNENSLPQIVSGEPFYDKEGRWIGVCLSSFGICYNSDSLRRLGIDVLPSAWSDLANPKLRGEVALADPTKSGSAAKTFEMIIQQQMQIMVSKNASASQESLAAGWLAGMQLIQRIGANARYFTDSGSKVPMDVSQGNASIGMSIDFYGRFQSEAVKLSDGTSRLQYFTPLGGSSVGADPIGMFRGAPNPEAAKIFIEFLLSMEGQKLWDFRVGTPDGPVRYALRRLPIRKELYLAEYSALRSDSEVNPYEDAKFFTYHPEWTASLFNTIAFAIRVMCLDPQDELQTAWKALIDAGFPPQATACFSDLSILDYNVVSNQIRPVLNSNNKIQQIELAKTLSAHFRAQYRKTAELAKKGE